MPRLFTTVLLILGLASSTCAQTAKARPSALDTIAESYVKLVLRIGLYDPDYVDAYYGPPEWKPAPLDSIQVKKLPYAELSREANALLEQLGKVNAQKLSEIEHRRLIFLKAHLVSVKGRLDVLSGKKMKFDEESKALYGIVAPQYSVDTLEAILRELDTLLPGTGELPERVEAYRKQFIVPKDKVDTVFTVAIAEARRRTRAHITLPENESFTVEYVTGQSWAAYNWYKGNNHSLIQINTDLPTYISSPLGLACHEGYPGHHVQNVLIEDQLLRGRGWVEFCVSPLYCPMSPLNEGAADYGIELAFPDSERLAFERDALFPLAGLDSSKADEYFRFRQLTKRLHGAGIEAARRYLDGKATRDETIAWLRKYTLRTEKEAERNVRFDEHYRSYVIAYDVGEDMVKAYIETHAVALRSPERRWELLRDLFAIPHVPSDLQ